MNNLKTFEEYSGELDESYKSRHAAAAKLTKIEKSDVVKKARAGKDIGKKGKNFKRKYDFVKEEIKFGKLGKLALAGGIAATMGLSSCDGPIVKDVGKNICYDTQDFVKNGKVVYSRSFPYGKFQMITMLIKTEDGHTYKVIIHDWDTYDAKGSWDFSNNTLIKKGDPVVLTIHGRKGFVLWNGKTLHLTGGIPTGEHGSGW